MLLYTNQKLEIFSDIKISKLTQLCSCRVLPITDYSRHLLNRPKGNNLTRLKKKKLKEREEVKDDHRSNELALEKSNNKNPNIPMDSSAYLCRS